MTRNLQAIISSACSINEYSDIIKWEANKMKISNVPVIETSVVQQMKKELKELKTKWNELKDGESLKLELNL